MAIQEVNLSTVLTSVTQVQPGDTTIQALRKQEKALFNATRESVRALGAGSSGQMVQDVFNRVTADGQIYVSQCAVLKRIVDKLQADDTANSNRVSRTAQKILRQECPLFPSAHTREMRLCLLAANRHAEKLKQLLSQVEEKKGVLESKNSALASRQLELEGQMGAVAALTWDQLKANTVKDFSDTEILVSGKRVQGLENIMNELVAFVEGDGTTTAARVQMFSNASTPIVVEGDCRELQLLKFATTQGCNILAASLPRHNGVVVPVHDSKFDSVHFSKGENSSFTIVAETKINIVREAGKVPYAQLTACMQTVYDGSSPKTTFIVKNIQANMNATRSDLENLDRVFPAKKGSTVSGVSKA